MNACTKVRVDCVIRDRTRAISVAGGSSTDDSMQQHAWKVTADCQSSGAASATVTGVDNMSIWNESKAHNV